ncbi:MAG TPA: hypothetical protein VGH80_12700 [Xanthomonadaceae bacterium]|jgi:hypothetical protein
MLHRLIVVVLCALPMSAVLAGQRTVGTMNDPRLPEVSGLAASHAHPGLLWVENDSDNPPDVYLVKPDGKLLMTLHVDGAPNVDWEDFASFDEHGRHYLLLADAGDNRAVRDTVVLYAIEEPATIADAHASPAWSIRFRWPGGPRDCEAVTVDVATGSILLISKRTVPAVLYRLPLHPTARGVLTAKRLGPLVGIPSPRLDETWTLPQFRQYLSQVTAADIAPDRGSIAVLTYRRAYLYRRSAGESWAQAVSHSPQWLPFGWLPQAEALTFRLDGRAFYVSGEHLPAPIVEVDVPASP